MAAEQDEYGETQNNLGEMYMLGCGVEQDEKQAAFWFLKAAEQGHEDAQFNLGKMYQEGFGVEQDDALAAHWLREVYREIYGDDGEDGEWYLDEQDHEKYSEWTCNYDHWAQRFPHPLHFPDETLTTVPLDMVVTLSNTGYIRAQSLAEYLEHPKARLAMYFGGIDKIFVASTHDYILCFTTHGYVRWISVNAVPQGDGVSCSKIFSMLGFDREKVGEIISVLPPQFCDNQFVFFATANGTVKKTSVFKFSNIPKRGTHAIALDEGDFLIGVALTDGKHDVMLFSDGGKVVRFHENDVRAMGRDTRGVRGMKLAEGQKVISLLVPESERQSVLTATENGYGKRTPIAEYTRHGRGTQGMIAIQTSARNSKVVAATLVDEDDEAILITSANRMFRARVNKIREMGRTAQGITLVNLSEGEKLSSLEKLVKPIMEK